MLVYGENMAKKMWTSNQEPVEKGVAVVDHLGADGEDTRKKPIDFTGEIEVADRLAMKGVVFEAEWLAESVGEKVKAIHREEAFILRNILLGDLKNVVWKGDRIPMHQQIRILKKYRSVIDDYGFMLISRAKMSAGIAAMNIGEAMAEKPKKELVATNIGSLAGALKTTLEVCDVVDNGADTKLSLRDKEGLMSAAADALQDLANRPIQGLTINIDNRSVNVGKLPVAGGVADDS